MGFVKKINVDNKIVRTEKLLRYQNFYYLLSREAVTPFQDLYLIKTDLEFNVLWSKRFTGHAIIDIVLSIDGGVICAMPREAPFSIVKFSSTGSQVWAKSLDITVSSTTQSTTISSLEDGAYVIFSDPDIVTFNDNGVIIASKTVKLIANRQQKLVVTSAGNGKIVGYGYFLTSRDDTIVEVGYITVFDKNLNVIHQKQISTPNHFTFWGGSGPSVYVKENIAYFTRSFFVESGETYKLLCALSLQTYEVINSSVKKWSPIGLSTTFSIGDSGVYYYDEDTDRNVLVHKFDLNLNYQWTKRTELQNASVVLLPQQNNDVIISVVYSRLDKFNNSLVLTNLDSGADDCFGIFSFANVSVENFNVLVEDKSYEILSLSTQINNNTPSVSNVTTSLLEQVCPEPIIPSITNSTITANPNSIEANGLSTSTITVQLKDSAGNNITTGGRAVAMTTSKGTLSIVVDNSDGTYTATLTSSISEETAIVSFTIDAVASPNTVEVKFIAIITINENTYLQSPHIYLQAAGSTGADGSVSGVHLRWMFKNKLGEQHLPKGDYAANELNFNKPNDYVKVYRAPYLKEQLTIDLATTPTLVDDQNTLWIYRIDNKKYFVHFRDQVTYQTIRQTINPLSGSSLEFIRQYGNKLIEIESKDELVFSAELTVVDTVPNSNLKTELLAVDDNKLSASKNIVARKTFMSAGLSNTYQSAENIRSVRYVATNCVVKEIRLELYSITITKINESDGWVELGKFALTKQDTEAFTRLESSVNAVNGKWPRFNDGCFVNLDNYKNRWSGAQEAGDRNLKEIVDKYITLSDQGLNPRALENISYSETVDGETISDSIEISNLDMLFIASLDYHMARMLGLGYLDTEVNNDTQKYIYMTEYMTSGNLGDGLGKRDVQHLYVSMPTGRQDERLPISIDLKPPVPGVPKRDGEVTIGLTDAQGYTNSGKQRYITLYAEELKDYHTQTFYETEEEFNTSQQTTPVYAGIEYKKEGETSWRRPEISSTIEYYNAPISGQNPIPETVPLSIPEAEESLFVHRETEEGTHLYSSYGINWFSRSQQSGISHSITTTFKPDNRLLPPSGINAVHIVEERPFVLTSFDEQVMLEANTRADNTMVRLLFDYNSEQELVSYKVTEEDEIKYPDLLDPNAIFKDSDEVFAEEIELFFRDEVPQNVTGKIKSVTTDPDNEILAVVITESYPLHSTGEEVIPVIPSGMSPSRFVGGVLAAGNDQFIIHSVTIAQGATPTFVVYKKEITDAIQNSIAPNPNAALQSPESGGGFMAIENMLSPSSWGANNPNSLKVQVPNWPVHREIILQPGADTNLEKTVEKTRGIWEENAKITEVLQAKSVSDTNEVTEQIHKGMYKIELNQTLAQHPQFATNANSVEWYGGAIRIHAASDPNGPRRILKIVKLENVGTTDNLVVYAIDETFQPVTEQGSDVVISYATDNPIETGNTVSVNVYPGYRLYLYADSNWGLTKENLVPDEGEGIKYSIFGLRSVDRNYTNESGDFYKSQIGTPGMMFTQEITDPLRPELPKGALYATRPDSFGKATYTLTTEFKHKPHSIIYYRADDQAILNTLYTANTVITVKEKLASFGKDVYFSSRWNNLLGFDYTYAANDPVNEDGQFGIYPPFNDGYRLPNPDNPALFSIINADINKFNTENNQNISNVTAGSLMPGSVIIPGGDDGEDTTLADYIKLVVSNAFAPLTEVPLLFSKIKSHPYQPINKKQVIRDRNGKLLKPTEPDFDVAPMAKKVGTREVLFTDFTLDGTSNNIYFYMTREMANTLQMSDFSPVLGPIKLVNTKAPEAPEIKRAIPVLASQNFELQKIALDFVDNSNVEVNNVNTITKISNDNWDAGVASRQILKGNGYVSFQSTNAGAAMVGFSRVNRNDHFNTIEYALYANTTNQLFAYRNGQNIKEIGDYDENSVLRIERNGNKILFIKDNFLLYSSKMETIPEGLLLDIAMHKKDMVLSNIELYSDDQYYTQETLEKTTIPLTYSNLDNIEIESNTITKIFGDSAWDAGGNTDQYVPFYGSVHYKVLNNTNVMLGLASYNENSGIGDIDFSLYAKEDGYLYVYNDGNQIAKCVTYDENSLLSIERRNSVILFKKNNRPFYDLSIEDNIPLLVDFSLYQLGSKIIDLSICKTEKLSKNLTPSLSTSPALSIELNSYQKEQNITKVSLYRTLDPTNSLSIRTMDLVKTVDLTLDNQINESIWGIKDEFRDLDFVPYGDPLFYRITVSREIEYAKDEGGNLIVVTEYAPSEPSKLLISSIVESSNPKAPEPKYSFDMSSDTRFIETVILRWSKKAHNGKYFVYKMNTQGNWVKIHEVLTNEEDVQLLLSETSLQTGSLEILDENSLPKYHHFKVDVENSAGMLNLKSNVLTIPGNTGIEQDEGVGSMIIENTNLIR
ncbi:Ig-like domain-containing protein [Aquimarina sp. D1M17]|uniref:Ig-like domain-containing protein n=1 Tax=Aquimarina acroporae TaxID=2937283 RepID=UPI0020BD7CC1|nr:Ig-like domain-containing protein [Aquimarina acroporae]MCK8523076.1 Ig-like domain-containing protein [Aquimarina acroporae]